MKKKNYKCGGTTKKYQIGGSFNKKNPLKDIPTPEQFAQDQGAAPNKANTIGFNPNYGASTFGSPVDNSNLLPFSQMENTGDLTYHPLFKLFNILAQATTGIANEATNAGIDKRERLQNIQSLQEPDYANTNQDGLDKSSITYKAGGFHLNPAHKGWCTPMTKSTCTGKRRQFAINAKNHFKKQQTGGRLINEADLPEYKKQGYVPVKGMPNYYQKTSAIKGELAQASHTDNPSGGDAYNQKLIQLLQSGHSIDDLVSKGYGTTEGLQQFSKYYKPSIDTVYIDPKTKQVVSNVQPTRLNMNQRIFDQNTQHAVGDYGWIEQKGTTTNPGAQERLGAFQPIDANGNPLNYNYQGIPDSVWRSVSQNNRMDMSKISQLDKYKKQAGGGEGSSEDEKLDQQVAAMLQQGASPQDVIQKLAQSGIPQAQATQVVQEVMQELQGQSQEGQPKQQAGGDDSPQDDNDGQTAELEEGENYQTPQGDIDKVPEGAGTHEQGGVVVPNVSKVLEDTSDKRKDKASKLLKIAPKQVESMLGFKPKTSLSHSKAHEKAIEFYNKKSNAITNKIKKNVDTRDENGNDSYALNSMKFNVNTLSQLPSEQDMFNTLFDHQEGVKSLFGIQDNGKKAQYGLKAYSGDKSFKGNASKYSTEQWNAMANDLGFKGSGDRAFQEFLFNQNGDVGKQDLQTGIIDLHNKFGNPNTPPATTSPFNWFDNRVGHRWDSAYEQWLNSKTQPDYTSSNGTAEDYADNPNITGSSITQPNNGVTNLTNTQYITNKSSNNAFNKPLQWYDVAGPLQALLGATKAPINYNPATVKQIQLKGVNPLPTLQQGQSDFNAELNALASTGVNGGVQFANAGNLYARKYAMNNQVLGNAENTNAGIKNQETMYNAGAADKQSELDQAARADFEKKNLATDEAVRQQKLTALDSLYTRIAQNKKFNLEGNLLMKLFPNFNPQGDFNGKQYQFRNPLSTGISAENLDLNSMLEASGVDPSSLTPKDRAKYIVQLGKYNARRQLLLNKR